ncbi:MAG: thioredoxin family protein [Candidatus Thermoplasmatota archaeon]|nr:thioredoxin family protein [Candidatus Thermoplasmatota archaeon]
MGILDIFKKGFKPITDRDPLPLDEFPTRAIILKEKDFEKAARKYPFLLLEFHADWCAPCKHMKPKIKWLAKELSGKVVVGTVDVERQRGLASRFRVRGIPRMILLHYGDNVESWMGFRDITKLSKDLLRYHRQYEEAMSESDAK